MVTIKAGFFVMESSLIIFVQNILAYSNKKLCMTAISCYILQNVNIVCILTSSLSFSYYHCHAACSLRSHYQRLLYVGSL